LARGHEWEASSGMRLARCGEVHRAGR